MLVIRTEQMKAFEEAARRQFENDMIAHGKGFSPRLCAVIGDAQLRVAISAAIDRAMAYGFTNRGPIRLFIEMMFLFGSAFDTDPQYPRVGELLRAGGDQMQCAQLIHEWDFDYFERVSGPDAVNERTALKDLSLFAGMPLTFSERDFESGMREEMAGFFPQKAVYVGADGLTALIQEGRAAASRHGFDSVRGHALIVALMFAFGHGCADDPLYPWISGTLQDERIFDPTARAARLERKAVTWLAQVVANNDAGALA